MLHKGDAEHKAPGQMENEPAFYWWHFLQSSSVIPVCERRNLSFSNVTTASRKADWAISTRGRWGVIEPLFSAHQDSGFELLSAN